MLLKEEKSFSSCARKDKEHKAFIHFEIHALKICIGLTSAYINMKGYDLTNDFIYIINLCISE